MTAAHFSAPYLDTLSFNEVNWTVVVWIQDPDQRQENHYPLVYLDIKLVLCRVH